MGAKEILFAVAAAAATWAVGVSGFSTNRPFMAFLLVVALALVVTGHHWESLSTWWSWKRGFGKWLLLILLLPVVAVGWYLGTSFNKEPLSTDQIVRDRVTEVEKQMAAVDARVKAAMQFQETEKKLRDEQQKADADDLARRQKLVVGVREIIKKGNEIDARLMREDRTARKSHEDWHEDAVLKLRQLGMSDCADEFMNPDRTGLIGFTYFLSDDLNEHVNDIRAKVRALRVCVNRLGG